MAAKHIEHFNRHPLEHSTLKSLKQKRSMSRNKSKSNITDRSKSVFASTEFNSITPMRAHA
jgi:hypothetical protein